MNGLTHLTLYLCLLPAEASIADTEERSSIDSLPSRLSGRHFLDVRRGGGRADCVVCGPRKRKKSIKDEPEEEPAAGKKVRLEEESGDVRVKLEEVHKQLEEAKEEKQRIKEEGEAKENEWGEASGAVQEAVHCAERQAAYCCKTCAGRPALCPVPCFELYHTRLLYRFAAQVDSAGEHSLLCPQPNTSSPLLPPPSQSHADKSTSGEL